MKLFQQLLVAPAALGLFAPIAANAAELNINGVSGYSSSSEEVQSITNFSDVYPTDWAHQALTKLVERHGCAAATPNGSMTRYEAAALLNSCLEKAAQINEEERALLNEFRSELAVIKGRSGAIEDATSNFEAGMFSPTTKISGKTVFTVGAAVTEHAAGEPSAAPEKNAVTFLYDTTLSLSSTFTGDDLLVTKLRTSNVASGEPFAADGITPLETFPQTDASDNLKIARNYYQFPVSDALTATIGAKVRQDDMLAVWPSSYPGDSVLDSLTYGGANAAYSLTTGAGAGLSYTSGNISASVLFVSEEGSTADPTSGGVLTNGGSDDVSAQLAWTGEDLTVAAVYTAADNGNTDGSSDAQDYEAWGLSADWQTSFGSEWLPTSISGGVGAKSVDKETKYAGRVGRGGTNVDIMDEWTWSVGLQWSDFIVDGNTLGFGIGSAEGWRDESTYDDPMAYELWYSMAVSDNITVTPAIFQVERDDDYAVTGGLVKTTFSF